MITTTCLILSRAFASLAGMLAPGSPVPGGPYDGPSGVDGDVDCSAVHAATSRASAATDAGPAFRARWTTNRIVTIRGCECVQAGRRFPCECAVALLPAGPACVSDAGWQRP